MGTSQTILSISAGMTDLLDRDGKPLINPLPITESD